jgi:hypothetical protein
VYKRNQEENVPEYLLKRFGFVGLMEYYTFVNMYEYIRGEGKRSATCHDPKDGWLNASQKKAPPPRVARRTSHNENEERGLLGCNAV